MIRLKEIVTRYVYIGNCQTGLDYEEFQNRVANDATELAQMVDNSIGVDRQQFVRLTGQSNELANEFGYNKYHDVVWSYNNSKDLHKFYVR